MEERWWVEVEARYPHPCSRDLASDASFPTEPTGMDAETNRETAIITSCAGGMDGSCWEIFTYAGYDSTHCDGVLSLKVVR